LNKYESMYILNTVMEEEAIGQAVEKYSQIVKDNGGEILEVKPWGKRRLAYPINYKNEGYYVLMTFKAESAALTELEHNYKIDENIVRSIVVRLEEDEKA